MLNKQHIRTQEWYLFDKDGSWSTGKPESFIPEFTPSNSSYKYEQINLKPSKSQYHRKRKELSLSFSIPPSPYLLCNTHTHTLSLVIYKM